MEKFDPSYLVVLDDVKEKLVKSFLESRGFNLYDGQIWKIDKDLEEREKKDFLLIPKTKGLYVKLPNKRRKDFDEVMIQLSHLRSYLLTFGEGVSNENFLNRFDNFTINGDSSEAYESAKKFLDLQGELNGLWIKGNVKTGKSHLLLSIAMELLRRRAVSDYKKLGTNEHNLCPVYKSEDSFSKEEFPVMTIKNYMGCYYWSSNKYTHNFGRLLDRTIYFLDDICERDGGEVVKILLDMFNGGMGRVALTSNLGINDWLKTINHKMSSVGLEDRIRSFVREVGIEGSVGRNSKISQ